MSLDPWDYPDPSNSESEGSTNSESENSTGSEPEEPHIPPRVKLHAALQITRSDDSDIGFALTAIQDIAAGEMVFSINRPMLLTVKFNPMGDPCDNCLDNYWDGYRCDGCDLMDYCSEECKTEAWELHHALECETLKEMKRGWTTPGRSLLPPHPSPVFEPHFRAAIRLVHLHENKRLGDGWEEIRRLLKKYNAEGILDGHCRRYMDIFRAHTKPGLTLRKLSDLVYLKGFSAMLPTLRRRGIDSYCTSYERTTDTRGYCFDPFVTLLTDDSLPNTWWIFEGHELRFRARGDIKQGEELTISYTLDEARNDYAMYEDENERSSRFFCSCSLHKSVQLGTASIMGEHIFEFNYTIMQNHTSKMEISKIQLLIENLLKSGGKENPHMVQLHQALLLGYFHSESYVSALKTALKMYYEIEPARSPPQLQMNRINTLYYLIIAMMKYLDWFRKQKQKLRQEQPIDGRALKGYFHHRAKLVSDTEKCFGADSAIAAHERRRFENCKQEAIDKDERNAKFIEIGGTLQQKQKYVADTNFLLKWAGVPLLTEKDFVGH